MLHRFGEEKEESMKSTFLTYVLWLVGGPLSIHRFYLGKYGSGFLYLLTGGLFGVGWVLDLFLIPGMVERQNLKMQLRQGASVNINIQGQTGQVSIEPPQQAQTPFPSQFPAQNKEQNKELLPVENPEKKLEQTILSLARKFHGQLTPLELAANSALSLDEADKALENIVRKGYANMKVTDEGHIIYEFPGFLKFDTTNSLQ